MADIKLLDCTLRDGGSVNNQNFGYENILKILKNLNNSNIEIVETGFLKDNVTESKDNAIAQTCRHFDFLLKEIGKKNFKAVAMIDFGKYSLDKLVSKNETLIDGIRLMFRKQDLNKIKVFSKEIKRKGYSLSLNPVSITTYRKDEIYQKDDIKALIETANDISPDIIYIIDTYGLMDTKETKEYFEIFDKNLKEGIEIGYHTHNNLQLAFSNSIEIINSNTKRNIVIDGSLYGMGKRAGNTAIELLTDYLNRNFNKQYDLNKINDIIESVILPMHKDYEWGYSLSHYIAAINKCHSDYVTYLKEEKNISFSQINNLLKFIPHEHKLTFNKAIIEEIYLSNFLKKMEC